MTAEEKSKVAFLKGYKCDLVKGIVYGPYGKEVSKLKENGYINIFINGINKNLMAHQYIFYIGHGYVPKLIDHFDRDKTNNSLSNLREYDKSKNAINSTRNINSKGYSFDKSRNKWQSRIAFNGKAKYLGRFDTEEEARQAYLNAKELYHI